MIIRKTIFNLRRLQAFVWCYCPSNQSYVLFWSMFLNHPVRLRALRLTILIVNILALERFRGSYLRSPMKSWWILIKIWSHVEFPRKKPCAFQLLIIRISGFWTRFNRAQSFRRNSTARSWMSCSRPCIGLFGSAQFQTATLINLLIVKTRIGLSC